MKPLRLVYHVYIQLLNHLTIVIDDEAGLLLEPVFCPFLSGKAKRNFVTLFHLFGVTLKTGIPQFKFRPFIVMTAQWGGV